MTDISEKPRIDWHWADEQLRGMGVRKKHSRLKETGKWILFFADEAVLILILAYIVYRLFW